MGDCANAQTRASKPYKDNPNHSPVSPILDTSRPPPPCFGWLAGVSDFAAILPSKMGAILAIGGSLPTVVQKEDGR